MPELPEVETVVRGLRPVLPGRRIASVRLGKTDFIDDPAALERELPGCRIADVQRRGKYIVLPLERDARGDNSPLLIVHLGMTGRLAVQAAVAPAAAHTHAYFTLDDGRELRFTDPRRFGRIALFSAAQFAAAFARLGAEPLEVSEVDFRRLLAGRRARIKALLLDQRFLRGIGNIYADESLWRAQLHPMRLGASLSFADAHRLLEAIRHILRAAIRLGGSSISDFVDANGLPGEFQMRHRAYDREGKGCFRCGARIRRIIVTGRSSYFCPRCQPTPRLRRAAQRKKKSARRK
ncbi:MAG: bifunctional DNA-formamidopyrimidine glycosylase/DNA-(apurinic or apyrimidinic site) lyase [Acidobacteria bacterium]|nr:bifunctional DNA-formamidopyrimidine glycosylase/DNA-(apurinic or apyrimidinic site) lyase [Acidobacteriota bacterium]